MYLFMSAMKESFMIRTRRKISKMRNFQKPPFKRTLITFFLLFNQKSMRSRVNTLELEISMDFWNLPTNGTLLSKKKQSCNNQKHSIKMQRNALLNPLSISKQRMNYSCRVRDSATIRNSFKESASTWRSKSRK